MQIKKIVTLHHSAISRKNLYEQFDAIKKGHIAKGWGDIGYHYFIEPSGKRKRGRPENMDGAHCYGFNKDNIGICVGGNFSIEYPTREQEIDLCKLLNDLDDKYIITIKHHRDFKPTQCPGNLLSKEWHKNLNNNNNKNMVDEKKLKQIYNEILLRDYDEGAKGYLGREEEFVRSEVVKSEERMKIISLINLAREIK